eukprot:9702995-Karenia_brevis.AAC.1
MPARPPPPTSLETNQPRPLPAPGTAASAEYRTIVPDSPRYAAALEPPAADVKVISLGRADPRE